MNQLHLKGTLGEQISVEFTDNAHRLQLMREWGARGFMSGEVPAGGYQLPYCMADTFDVTLIGGRRWKNPEGEEVILHGGRAYKRRELAANEKKNMPAVIKYSRGAKSGDPEHLKEGEDGGFQYVTLLVFKSNGKSISDFEMPRQGVRTGAPVAPEAEPEPPAPPLPIGPERGAKLTGECAAALEGTKYAKRSPLEIARHVFKRPELQDLGELTEEEGRAFLAKCRAEQERTQAA